MTKQEAIALAKTGWWKKTTLAEAALWQLYEEKLCMDFSAFHEGVEQLLGRPVWTHEFASLDRLKAEAVGRANRPTIEDIMNLIPAKKRIVVVAP